MFQGVLTAIVTPFRDHKLDEAALEKLVDQQVAAGVHGIVAVGTTGESPTLSDAEHSRVVARVVAAARGKVRVIAGAGSNDTQHAAELAVLALKAKADGLLVVTPYYNRPTQAGLIAHVRAVIAAAPLPTVLYNIPSRTQSDLLPESVARLAEHEPIVAIKEATGSVSRATEILRLLGERLTVLAGDDAIALPMYAVGAKGVVSVLSNIAPAWMLELDQAVRTGDAARARRVHERIQPLAQLLFCEPNPTPIKAALALRGQIADELRLPLLPMTRENRARLKSLLEKEDLL